MLILGGLVTQVGGEHHNEEITRKLSQFHTEFPGMHMTYVCMVIISCGGYIA